MVAWTSQFVKVHVVLIGNNLSSIIYCTRSIYNLLKACELLVFNLFFWGGGSGVGISVWQVMDIVLHARMASTA